MSRLCARPGCSQPATATLAYGYATQTATLERLSPESHPMTHDLCERHADGLRVPRGWRLEDRRAVASLHAPALDTIDLTDDAREPASVSALPTQLAS